MASPPIAHDLGFFLDPARSRTHKSLSTASHYIAAPCQLRRLASGFATVESLDVLFEMRPFVSSERIVKEAEVGDVAYSMA